MNRRIAVAVTNDLTTDQRVQRTIGVLRDLGAEVVFIGRTLPESQPFSPGYKTLRFSLWFRKGALFYAAYNLRLFWHLLWNKYDAYLANDADTLLAVGLASSLKGVPFVYDSHEFFTGVPEIQNRPMVIKAWKWIERTFYPKAAARIAVNESIAKLLQAEYGGELPHVVRNIGNRPDGVPQLTRTEVGLPEDVFIAINQGAGINVERGMEEALEAISDMSGVMLLIVGDGDAVPALKAEVERKGLHNAVRFVSKMPYRELLGYTRLADVGLSLDKPTSINYQYSLPNKLFDYLHSDLPVVTSGVVEVRRIVEEYQVGEIVDSSSPESIQEGIERVRQNGSQSYAPGIERAKSELTWNQESGFLGSIFRPLLIEQK